MTTARLLAGAAVLAGIAVNGAVADPPRQPLAVANGYTILAGDFHVHSYPDGLPAWEVIREAHRRRLDVVALTSHNWLIGWTFWRRAPYVPPGATEVLVLPGEELTSAGYHMALVGVSSPVAWRQPIAGAAAAAHAQQAVAILAHPAGTAVKRVVSDEGLRALDGIEVAHPGMEHQAAFRADLATMYRRAISVNPSVAAIGSSDFHYFAPVGACRTYIFVRERTRDGVLDAIRTGKTVACDARGLTYGPSGLVPSVAERCRRDALSAPDGDTVVSRLGTWLAVAGMAALVLFGFSRP